MCDECLFIIAEKEGIKLQNKYQCKICKEAFKTKSHFRMHDHCIFDVDALVYICEECSQVRTEEKIFETHMKQNHMKHVCVRCKAKLKGKINLDAHFRAKHRAFSIVNHNQIYVTVMVCTTEIII